MSEKPFVPSRFSVSYRLPERLDDARIVHARDPYVERYWLPDLGPNALVLLRRLALDSFDVDHERRRIETEYETSTLAATLGLRGRPARRSLWLAFERLSRFGFAERTDDGWTVTCWLPVRDEKHYRRLPDGLGDELAAAAR